VTEVVYGRRPVFEALRVYAGRPFRLREHLDRLAASAAALELPLPGGLEELATQAVAEAGNGDAVLRLPLGADEQDTAALGDGIADSLQRAMQQRHGLGEIDDVDVVAGTENVIRHFRIPAVRLVTKVNASFKQLAHREIGYCHSHVLRLVPPETCEQASLMARLPPDGLLSHVSV